MDENVFFAITSKVPFTQNAAVTATAPVTKPQPIADAAAAATSKGTKPMVSKKRVPLAPRPQRPVTAPAATFRPGSAPAPVTGLAKHLGMASKMDRVMAQKGQWAKDNAAKKQAADKRRADELRFMQEAVRREAEMRRRALATKKEAEFKKVQTEKETFVAFSTDRVHAAKTTERLKKERRKQSVLVRCGGTRRINLERVAISRFPPPSTAPSPMGPGE